MQNEKPSAGAERPRQSTLALIEAFRHVPQDQLAELEQRLITLAVRRGDVLMREGDDADALYIVASGRFAVERSSHRVGEIPSGSPIGEVAFFADGKRTATVTALRDSVVLKLPRADFQWFADKHPAALQPIAVTLARRLADTLAETEASRPLDPHTIAVVGVGDAPVPETFRQKLTDALSEFGQVLTVDSASLAERFPNDPDLDSEDVTNWLNRQEKRYHYVLYVTDDAFTAFSRKAVRQADLVLLTDEFRTGPDDAGPNQTERFALEVHAPESIRLVLLHESRAPIAGTARWLKTRPVALPHHLATDSDADYARLARFISGNAVGFVASGGGALCAAHIGVYKALTEAGLAFDILGGTSGGGAMAAAFALGATPDEVSARTADIFLKARALRRVTWPRYSLLDHTVFDRALRIHYGETDIEDLWTNYFAVAVCLARNELTLITRGPVWKAVRATSAIPGLLPPVYCEDGGILVDGSLLDNVPVEPMHALKGGPNFVVNLRSNTLQNDAVDYAALPSRGRLLLQVLNPFRKRLPNVPGVATLLLRSMMVRRAQLSDSLQDDDILITPPLPPDVGVMDWHRHAELSARAYEYTAKVIEDLRASGHPLFRRI